MQASENVAVNAGLYEPRITKQGRMFVIEQTDSMYKTHYWSAKRGEWFSMRESLRYVSHFRSREAAELELKRIKLRLTPEYPKSKLRKL